MKIFTVLIILNCLFSNAYAQKIELEVGQIVYANYQTGQIQPNPFTRFKFRVQGEQNTSFRKIGGGGRVIRPYIAKNPQAVKYLDKYRNKRTMAILSGVAAAGSFIAFAGINLKYLGENNKPNNTDNLKTQVPWLLGSASLGVPKCNFTSYPTMPATPVVLSPALLGVFTKQLHPYALPATRLSVRIQGQPILPIPEMMGRKHMQEI